MLFRALFLFLPCLIAWSSPSLILLLIHSSSTCESFNYPRGFICFSHSRFTNHANTVFYLTLEISRWLPRPGSSEDFLRSPLFAPLANNFISCHVIFLLFTLRWFLSCSCFKKNSAVKDIKRPHEMVITGSKTPGLWSSECYTFGLADLQSLLWPRHYTSHWEGKSEIWSFSFLKMCSFPPHKEMKPLE